LVSYTYPINVITQPGLVFDLFKISIASSCNMPASNLDVETHYRDKMNNIDNVILHLILAHSFKLLHNIKWTKAMNYRWADSFAF